MEQHVMPQTEQKKRKAEIALEADNISNRIQAPFRFTQGDRPVSVSAARPSFDLQIRPWNLSRWPVVRKTNPPGPSKYIAERYIIIKKHGLLPLIFSAKVLQKYGHVIRENPRPPHPPAWEYTFAVNSLSRTDLGPTYLTDLLGNTQHELV